MQNKRRAICLTANRRPQNSKLDVSQLERKPQTREQAKAAAKQIREWNKGSKKRNADFLAKTGERLKQEDIRRVAEKANKRDSAKKKAFTAPKVYVNKVEQRAEEEKRTGKKREPIMKDSNLFSKESRAKLDKQMKKSIANIRKHLCRVCLQGTRRRRSRRRGTLQRVLSKR